ncbi:hypothetical protein, partial [Klebsiella pneumoniae]|uniref:hypothetical protein n=1 Tax=Klebsiella pneumoniae TaxID=573 RepID=UPI001953B20F
IVVFLSREPPVHPMRIISSILELEISFGQKEAQAERIYDLRRFVRHKRRQPSRCGWRRINFRLKIWRGPQQIPSAVLGEFIAVADQGVE